MLFLIKLMSCHEGLKSTNVLWYLCIQAIKLIQPLLVGLALMPRNQSNIYIKKNSYTNQWFSSDKGKSFDENFAVFAFRSLAKNAKKFPFFAKFRLNLFCEKLQNKKCKNLAKLYMQKFLGKQNAKYCVKNMRERFFVQLIVSATKTFHGFFYFLAKFLIIFAYSALNSFLRKNAKFWEKFGKM